MIDSSRKWRPVLDRKGGQAIRGEARATGTSGRLDARRAALRYGPTATAFALTAGYALIFHFRAPYYDQWQIVAMYERMAEGSLRLGDLFALHAGHWAASGMAVQLALARATGMSHVAEIVASLVFAVLGFWALAKILSRAAAHFEAPEARATLFAIAALFWFSLDQAINWLWGWQVSVFINTGGVAWSILLLTSDRLTPLKFALALLAASAAVFSFATGFAILPIGVALLLLNTSVTAKARTGYAATWAGASAVLLFLFLRANFEASDSYARTTLPAGVDADWPLALAAYCVNYLASPIVRFAEDSALPMVAFGVGVAIWAMRVLRLSPATLRRFAPFFGLIAYAVGAALLTGVARVELFGSEQAFVSRYISFGNFFWIGALALFVLAIARKGVLRMPLARRMKKPSALLGALLLVSILKVGNSISVSVNYAKSAPERAAAIKRLIDARPMVDRAALNEFAAPGQSLDAEIAVLERRRLSFFRDPD